MIVTVAFFAVFFFLTDSLLSQAEDLVISLLLNITEDERSMSKQWYIVHTYSGFEKKVKESLEGRVAAFGLTDKIGQIVIPTESVVEVRGGKKVISPRMCYPGYVLVEMDMDDYTWHVVRSTPRVTGFVGSGQTPSPLTEEEVQNILNRATTTAEKPKPKLSFERGEKVRIGGGPFANFTRRGRGSEFRSQHAEGFGDDFWALDAGGAGFRAGGKSRVAESDSRCRLDAKLRNGAQRDGEENSIDSEVAVAGGESDAGAARGHGAWSARREHHGFLQAVQRQDRQRAGRHDYSRCW